MAQVLGHLVEVAAQLAQLGGAVGPHPGGEVAGRDLAGEGEVLAQPPHHRGRDEEGQGDHDGRDAQPDQGYPADQGAGRTGHLGQVLGGEYGPAEAGEAALAGRAVVPDQHGTVATVQGSGLGRAGRPGLQGPPQDRVVAEPGPGGRAAAAGLEDDAAG